MINVIYLDAVHELLVNFDQNVSATGPLPEGVAIFTNGFQERRNDTGVMTNQGPTAFTFHTLLTGPSGPTKLLNWPTVGTYIESTATGDPAQPIINFPVTF